MPGEVLFRIAELSAVWVFVDVFEQDWAGHPGRKARFRSTPTPERIQWPDRFDLSGLAQDPNRQSPHRTAQSQRPVKARHVRQRRAGRGPGRHGAIPGSAVMDSGARQVVLIDKGEGRYEPRAVKLGGRPMAMSRCGRREAGEPVVVSANFLIDAESNLKAALGSRALRPSHRRRPLRDHPVARPAAPRDSQMLGRLIEVRPKHLPGPAGNGIHYRRRNLRGNQHAAGCPARSVGRPGHHLYRVSGAGAPGGGRPGDLSLEHRHVECAASRVVRGFSFFGASFVYVIFEDGTDIYWARSRVLEYLNFAAGRLPRGVAPQLGPDATGVGWVYQYALLGRTTDPGGAAHAPGLVRPLSAGQGAGRRRGGQPRRFRPAVPGDGGPPQAAGLPDSSEEARQSERQQPRCRRRAIEMAETEYMVRGKGYLRGRPSGTTGGQDRNGVPILLRDVARVELARTSGAA